MTEQQAKEDQQTKKAVLQEEEEYTRKEAERMRTAVEKAKQEDGYIPPTDKQKKNYALHLESLKLVRKMQRSTAHVIPFQSIWRMCLFKLGDVTDSWHLIPAAVNALSELLETHLVHLLEAGNRNAIAAKRIVVQPGDILNVNQSPYCHSAFTYGRALQEADRLRKAQEEASEELASCKSKITDLQSQIEELTSVPVYDLANQEVGRMQRETSDVIEGNNRKRKRRPEETLEHMNEVVRVKLEKTEERAKTAEEGLDDMEIKTDCMSCMDATVQILCLPCNHLVTCGDCFQKIKDGKCIKCREDVTASIEVGFP